MKNSKLALTVVLLIALVAIAYLLIGKQADKPAQTVQNPGTQQDNAAKPGKENSFSVKKPTDNSDTAFIADIAKGKNYLVTQVDNRLKQMSTFRSRVENTVGFDEAERKMIVDELNDEISEFAALKAEINKGETKDDVKNLAEKVKAVWLKSRATVDKAQGKLVAAKEKSVLSDAENYTSGIQKRIEILKASGKSTKDHEELLANYSKRIEAAKKDSEQAIAMAKTIDNAKSDEEKEKLKKENERLLKSSHENIKEAYKMLKDEAKQEFSQRFK
jgi:hypothetical protein